MTGILTTILLNVQPQKILQFPASFQRPLYLRTGGGDRHSFAVSAPKNKNVN